MNFSWSSELEDVRTRIKSFLESTLPDDWDSIACHGPGSAVQIRFSREYCPKLAAAGLLVPHWPRQHGGRDASVWEHFIIGEELWAAGEPRAAQYMNVNWIGPTIMRYGTHRQQRELLPPMTRGAAVWCQGFSEPGAGSDLASLRTRADRVGDEYVVNGSKIWTSYASEAEHCFLLARTSPDRKAGIGIFIVPMSAPGVVVRKIPSLVGEGDIHEVFFNDVRLPAECRLGEEGQGWEIILYSLQNERLGIPRYAFARRTLDRAVQYLQSTPEASGPDCDSRAGLALAACEAARLLVYQVVDRRQRGQPDAGGGAIARTAVVAAERAVMEFVLEFLPEQLASGGNPLFRTHHQRAIAVGVASGAAEIQLDLVARAALDLPREKPHAA